MGGRLRGYDNPAASDPDTVRGGATDGRGALTLLFIGGWGRSGSTLLERMLGQIDGAVSVGETRDVFQRGWVENRLCGCGARFRECAFWLDVGDEAFGGWDAANAERLAALRYRVERPWLLPVLVVPRLWPSYARRQARYLDALERLFQAIASVSGASVVIDSSKIPTYALLLRRIRGFKLSVVHLVRDSRGVIYSWRKEVRRLDAESAPDTMLRYGTVAGSIRYLVYNWLTRLLSLFGLPYHRVRYETLIKQPATTIRDIARRTHLDADPLRFVDGDTATLAATHTVDGNPMRLVAGPVHLRIDDAWRNRLNRKDTMVVTLLTLPLLRAYGYLPRRRGGTRA